MIEKNRLYILMQHIRYPWTDVYLTDVVLQTHNFKEVKDYIQRHGGIESRQRMKNGMVCDVWFEYCYIDLKDTMRSNQ